MWLWRETELNWVRTWIRLNPEFRQLLMGMSTRRYLPPVGTAGLERNLVSGYRRLPTPPPRISTRTSLFGIEPLEAKGCETGDASWWGCKAVATITLTWNAEFAKASIVRDRSSPRLPG